MPGFAHAAKDIAKNALTILINLSTDREVLKNLAEDEPFLESLLSRITVSFPFLLLRSILMKLIRTPKNLMPILWPCS